ncbi:hypothetical protein GCM10027299_49000 [Larkinella ripae]
MNTNRIQQLLLFIEEQPDEPFNVYALAMEYREEQPEQAMNYLRQLLEQYPKYLPSYYPAAALATEQNDRSMAETIYQRGIALAGEQKNEKAYQELNRAYRTFLDDEEEW